ncbi:MAG: hypothetical protein AAF518_05915 [Spirochaetota bacterium]
MSIVDDEKITINDDIEINTSTEFAEEEGQDTIIEGFDPDKVLELIDIAAERALKGSRDTIDFPLPDEAGFPENDASELIDKTSEEILEKEQAEYLQSEVMRRFERIKKMDEDDFNMFEFAVQCHKIVQEYKRLAKLKDWSEILHILSDEGYL